MDKPTLASALDAIEQGNADMGDLLTSVYGEAQPAAELSDAIERANAHLIAHPEPVAEPVAELTDEEIERIIDAAKIQCVHPSAETTRDIARAINRALLARSPAQPQKAAQPAAMSDAEINDITMNKIGKWPSFEAQSWACKVVHAVLAALPPVQSESKDAERYRFVKTMSKEMLLFWRGAYSFDDAAIDAAIAASQFTAKEVDNGE